MKDLVKTWWLHPYRVKLKQIYDSQEFKDILKQDAGNGDGKTLRDVLSTYEAEMNINNAVVQQAEADAGKSVTIQVICTLYKLTKQENVNWLPQILPS